MEIDIKGKINEKKLAYSNTLLPLFEAIVNSIQAIDEESATKPGIIEIDVVRSTQKGLELDGQENLPDIIDFIIKDNELAFNDHWIPILFEETVEFEFKKSVELKDYSVLLKSSKERNILKLSRDNYSSGINKIKSGINTIDEIQHLIRTEIK
jgi:hypothetical protein